MPTATSTAFHPAASPTAPTPPTTLPPGNAFDLLPPALQALTTLLESPNFLASGSGGTANGTLNGESAAEPSSSGAADPAAPAVQDLPELMVRARRKIQAAREAVRALPDIDISVAEQKAEMAAVEARIERLRGVWAAVKAEARMQAKLMREEGVEEGRGEVGKEVQKADDKTEKMEE